MNKLKKDYAGHYHCEWVNNTNTMRIEVEPNNFGKGFLCTVMKNGRVENDYVAPLKEIKQDLKNNTI